MIPFQPIAEDDIEVSERFAQEVQETCAVSRLPGEKNTSSFADDIMRFFNLIAYLLITSVCIYISILCFRNEVVLFTWHPFCMTIGFLAFTSTAILMFNKHNLPTRTADYKNRFKWHWILQLFGLIFIAIGFTVILENKDMKRKSHFTTWHGIIGLIAFITLSLTFVLSFLTWIYKGILQSFSRRTQILMHIALAMTSYSIGTLDMLLGFFSGWFTRNSNVLGTSLCFVSVITVALHVLWSPFAKRLINANCIRS